MHPHATHPAAQIRSAQPEDLPAVAKLLKSAGLRSDEVVHEAAEVWVAQAGGRIVGAVCLELHGIYGMLRSLVVHRECRGDGLGSALTATLLETAASRRLEAVYLLATTAVTFFPRFGFEDIAREEVPLEVRSSRDFTDTSPASAVVMRLALSKS